MNAAQEKALEGLAKQAGVPVATLRAFGEEQFRLNNEYKIRTKDRRLITFKENAVQADYYKKQTSWDLILKARQMGITTQKVLQKLDFAMYTPNTNTAIIAHDRPTVVNHFAIIKLAYEMLEDKYKPVVSYDNRYELSFPEIKSRIYVTMEPRGETVHNLHVSEAAFITSAETKMAAILETVPKGGIVSIETTANGMSGWLYDLWNDKNSKFKKHFYNWTWDPDYFEDTDKDWDTLRAEYEPLAIQYGLIKDAPERFEMTKEQLNWYLGKIRAQRRLVVQEYPLTDFEAFISFGKNVFDIYDLQKHQAISPIDRKWEALIWEKPLTGFKYVIGCDSSEGIGQDNAAIEVVNAATGNQVAEYASPHCPPDMLAGYLIDLGKMYNNAFIVLEINNHGLSVADRIKSKYANVYHRQVLDTVTKQYKQQIGWKTTATTKPVLVNDLEEGIRNQTLCINSEEALRELRTFVRTDDGGKHGYGAEGTAKDDRVIALGLAMQGIKVGPRMAPPKTQAQKVLEEYIAKTQGSQYLVVDPFHNTRVKKHYEIRKGKANVLQ